MSKPTILLVGGAWHTAEYLKPLATTLEAAGYPVVAIGLPSVSADPSKPDFRDDVATIHSTVSTLISKGKMVLAVMHSYGGIAGTEALQEFHDQSRNEAGAVLGLMYIATMLPKKGDSFEAHLESVGDYVWKPAREAMTMVFTPIAQINATVCSKNLHGISQWNDGIAAGFCGRHVLQRS